MPVTIGAIGLGLLGQIQLELAAEREDTTILTGADVAPEARETFEDDFDAPAYEDYQEMLEKHGEGLDVVFIVSPHTLHYEHAKACLEAGAHVHLEKPMTTDVSDAQALIDLAADRDLVLQIGYQRHFHPGYIELKRIVDSGRLGELHTVSAYMGQRWITTQRGTWRTDPSLSGGGQFYDSGSHLVDTLLWVTGGEPKSVAAIMDYYDADVDVNSALTATLEGSDRPITVSIGISGDGKGDSPNEGIHIWGTEGRVSYEEPMLTVDEYDGQMYTTEVTDDLSFVTLTREKLTSFFGAVHGENEIAVDGEFGLQVTAFTEAAYHAAETERVVDVGSFLEESSTTDE